MYVLVEKVAENHVKLRGNKRKKKIDETKAKNIQQNIDFD